VIIPPTIQLTGIRLRPLRVEDAVAWHSYLNDPAVIEWTSYPIMSRAEVGSMIERCRAGYATGTSCTWALTAADDRLRGTCGFCRLSRAAGVAELAYDLARPWWGRGYMSQAVGACVNWVFGWPEFDRVEAHVMVGNRRSKRVLERARFRRKALLKAYRTCRGQPRDYHLFTLSRAEWEAGRRGRPTGGRIIGDCHE
jgi:ribosomal-protein-alanine N-acetyltransferase